MKIKTNRSPRWLSIRVQRGHNTSSNYNYSQWFHSPIQHGSWKRSIYNQNNNIIIIVVVSERGESFRAVTDENTRGRDWAPPKNGRTSNRSGTLNTPLQYCLTTNRPRSHRKRFEKSTKTRRLHGDFYYFFFPKALKSSSSALANDVSRWRMNEKTLVRKLSSNISKTL